MLRPALVSFLLLLGFSCDRHDKDEEDDAPSSSQSSEAASAPKPEKDVKFTEDDKLAGMRLSLREVIPEGGKQEAVAAPPATKLADADAQKLLDRAAPLKEEEGDRKPFALRPASVPPPRTGATVQEAFPPEKPAAPKPETTTGELHVVRHAPDGEVAIAPHVEITFDQPMVPLTSQEDAAKTVPVTLTPQPKGHWRWLGTKTLVFDPEPLAAAGPSGQGTGTTGDRLPMATDYKVEIPAGTKSDTGGTLAKGVTFTFSTPAPVAQQLWPNYGPQGLTPVIFVGFDQAVDPAQVAPHVVLAGGGKTFALRPATEAEVKKDPTVSQLSSSWMAGRWLALVPKDPLPKATSFTLTVPKGTPSAEGPRTTQNDQSQSFATYAPLTVIQHECSYGGDCPPTSPWYVEFDNPIDVGALDPSAWKVDPPVPGLSITGYGDVVNVAGAFQGRTTYTLTVPGAVKDVFGQTLGKDATYTFKVGPAEKTLYGTGKSLVVLDPAAGGKLPVWSTNYSQLRLRVFRVTPELWDDWVRWTDTRNYDDRNPGPPPGDKLVDTTIKVAGEADKLGETDIDLTKYVAPGQNQLIVWVEPTTQPKNYWERQEVLAWVESTKIGLSAFWDYSDLVAWTTDLSTGAPVDGADVSILSSGKQSVAGKTGGDGLADLAVPQSPEGAQVLVARKGDDLAILPNDPSGYSDYPTWVRYEQLDALRWYVFDDRGLYRPGEDVKVKGWLRRYEPGKGGDVQALAGGKPAKIHWRLTSSTGNELGTGDTTVSALGGFDLALTIPKDANLGAAQLELDAVDPGPLGDTVTYHPIQIEEFRRPEFEVTATAEEGPHVLGEEAHVDVTASYYAGGGLPGADVTWTAWATPSSYVPPNRDEWQFGPWSPWWIVGFGYDDEWGFSGGYGLGIYGGYGGGGGYSQAASVSLQGKTDATGQHHAGVRFEAENPARPYTVTAQATIMDVNRQAWTAETSMLVHPADLYVGMKTPRGFVDPKDPVDVQTLVVDLDGKAVSGVPVHVHWARMEWGYDGGKWGEQEKDAVDCDKTSADDAQTCTFEPELGGEWRATATIADSHGRKNLTAIEVWVSGGDVVPSRSVEQEKVTLVPEKETYQPGETAKILVRAPFVPAEGTMTIRRSGLVETKRFTMKEATTTLEVPVVEGYIPNFTVQVDLTGAASRLDDQGKPRPDLAKRVAYGTGQITFQVPPLDRTLKVIATPKDAAVQPGASTSIDVAVLDDHGRPVKDAEVAVVVADESVLALTGYQLPDPIALFYAARTPDVTDMHLRAQVVLGNPNQLPAATPGGVVGGQLGSLGYMDGDASGLGGLGARGMGMGGGGTATGTTAMPMAEAAPVSRSAANHAVEKKAKLDLAKDEEAGEFAPDVQQQGQAIATRTDFSALALFAPDVHTDASGHATVPLKVPDSLTRYRVMVVAVAGGQQFGKGESAVTARLPLMVRPSPPRFANFGDQFELPIVVQNQTDQPMTVDVAVRATNTTLEDAIQPSIPDAPDKAYTIAGKRVTVPANDRVEVRFPAATVMAGTARFEAVAASGSWSDAAKFEIPVWTPATTEAFATYGEVDQGAIVQPVKAPPDVWPQFGGLEVETSSTQLQALTDALLYLVQYPYDCNEQIASRVLAVASLRDVLTAFHADGLPDAKTLEGTVDTDMERLHKRQNWDGGFSMWAKGDESWPYVSIYAAHTMSMAKAKGYDVPEDMRQRSLGYLQTIESHLPWWYSQEEKWALRAYALSVRHDLGDPDPKEAKRLLKEAGVDKLPIEAQGWILPTLYDAKDTADVQAIETYLTNHVSETAGAAHFVTGYSDGEYVLMWSDRRVDGIVLDALIRVDPKNDLIPKVVRGLLGHRTAGHWENTDENAWVLTAMDRYFHQYENETPDFVARVWLGDGYAGDHAFKGRTTERADIDVPMGYLTETPGEQPLTIQRDGTAGRLYYRAGLKYAPKSLRLDPADYGFTVTRQYEAVDDKGDVTKDKDGRWHVKAGARVRVRVTMVTEGRRVHVALVDPLPAGLEVVNPELATSGTLPSDPNAQQSPWWWWGRSWWEHENLRDDRVEAFASLVWEGVHEYTYIARATTPGRYVVPPSKAEEMYSPETFGRSGTDLLSVE